MSGIGIAMVARAEAMVATPIDENRSALICRLVAYVRAKPFACDSCEGIARWWLGLHLSADCNEVQQAIDWLVAAGAMQRLPAADGRIRYRRGQSERASDEALAVLQSIYGNYGDQHGHS